MDESNDSHIPNTIKAGFFPDAECRMPKNRKAKPLRRIDQIAILVADVDAAIEYLGEVFGWGPFYIVMADDRGRHRDRVSDYRLKLAFYALTPDIEIELIQHVEGDTPHVEHMALKGEGLFHLRFKTDEIDHDLAHLERCGVTAIWDYVIDGQVVNAYVDSHQRFGVRAELIRPVEQLLSIVAKKFA